MSYPTQEDELRAKEAQAEDMKNAEAARFLTAFRGIPKRNGERLAQLANTIVGNFNGIMSGSRQKSYERQEDIMAGMKKLFQDQINAIEARHAYTVKINPSTALKED